MINDHTNGEILSMIEQCIEPLDEGVRLIYLINVLTAEEFQGKTIKQIFETELKSMKQVYGS